MVMQKIDAKPLDYTVLVHNVLESLDARCANIHTQGYLISHYGAPLAQWNR